jgi:hypothetical protein
MAISRVSAGRSVSVPVWLLPVLVVAGAVLGGVAVYARTSGYGVPRTETGTVTMVNVDGAMMGFQRDGDADARGLDIGIITWTDRDGTGHTGNRPDCLRVGSRVELSIVNIRNGNVHGEDVVTYVRCLG